MKFAYTASMRCAATILAASAIYFASPLFSETAVAESEFRARDTILDGLTLEPIAFNPPPVAETELTGGAHLFTAADDTLPYVTLSFIFSAAPRRSRCSRKIRPTRADRDLCRRRWS